MKTLDELVDEASMESFPASDPPSFWGRTESVVEDRAGSERIDDAEDASVRDAETVED